MARRSKEDTEKTREAIVDAAARLLRKRGIGAVSVADIMAEVGMTVGGFYKHFESKEALVSEAIEHASHKTADQLRSAGACLAPGSVRLGAVVDQYLSAAHRQHPEHGCPIAALATEAAQEGGTARQELERALIRLIGVVEEAGGECGPRGSRRTAGLARPRGATLPGARILHAVAASVGAVVLARAIDDKDLEEALIAAVREGVLGK